MATLATVMQHTRYTTSAFNQRSSPSGRSHPQPVVRSTGPHHQHSSLLRTAAVAQGHARFQSAFVPRASASEFLGGGGEECATLYAEEPSGRGVSERHATTPTPLDLLNTPHEANLEQTMGEPGTSGSSHHPQHHPLPLLVRVFRHWSTAVLAATVVAAVAVVEVLGLTGYSAPYATLLDYVRSQLDAGYAVIEPNLTLEMTLSTAPLFFSFILQSSGFPTMLSIIKEKTTGERSALPYVAMLANCSVWTVYGALRADATCMLVNGLGAAFGSLYTLTFALNTQQPMRAYFALLAAVVGGASGAALLFEQAAAAPIGILGATACMVMLASPLATVREVLTSRSTASMPFAMTVAGFFNAMSWTAYGVVVAHDPMMYVPNGFGLLAGLAQLALFARFGVGSRESPEESLVASKMV